MLRGAIIVALDWFGARQYRHHFLAYGFIVIASDDGRGGDFFYADIPAGRRLRVARLERTRPHLWTRAVVVVRRLYRG